MKAESKRILSFLLTFFCIMPMLSACFEKKQSMEGTSEDVTSVEAVEEESGLKKIYLVKSQAASEQVGRIVDGAYELIAEQTGIEVEIVSDALQVYEAEKEYYYVIFGDTSYAQSKALANSAEENKIYYSADEDSVAIYAATDQLLTIGAEKLFADCVRAGTFAVGEEYRSLTVDASGFVKDAWALNCPAFMRGTLDQNVYNVGVGMERNRDACYMHISRGVVPALFQDYLKQLEALGYRKDFENEIDGNLYASYVGALGSNIYVYYTKAKYEIRIIEDKVSTPLSEFNYQMDASGATRLYAFKMGYKSEDCFLIHLADNSWILIDGGNTGLTPNSSYVKDLYTFMVERSNLGKGEKLQIACWYLTHAHGDHLLGAYGLFNEYGDKLEIHRVIDNTAADGYFTLDNRKEYEDLLEKIRKDNPAVMYLKIHTGMIVELADTVIETIFTHEDYVLSYINGGTTNPNRGSTVAVFNIAGLTFLETADNFVYESYQNFSIETLTTDVLKIAHHYYDKTMDKLYSKLHQTGKVAYCYNPRLDTTANAANNYQAPTMELFGDRYLQGSATKIYEFYRDGNKIQMNILYD